MVFRCLAATAWLLCGAPLLADDAPAAADEFDARVAPVLARRCLECHNGSQREGGLDLTRRATALAGGDSGAALVPGKLDESYLWQRVSAGEMPPEDREPVSAEERAILEQWIAAGAAWGSDPIDRFRYTSDKRAGRDWWAFQQIERPDLPAVKDAAWPRNEIDHFILARLEAAGLSPSPEADRRTLVRRLHFDLTGLPPTPEEVAAFVADESPDAYEKLVDRLLESPHYGERWARHWLDVVRFGESQGFQRNWLRPDAWKYRDWVILALNQDMPYDEFVRRQIAGDILFPNDPPAIAATGYLVAGPYDLQGQDMGGPRMMRQSRAEELADNVATLGQTFLGLTIQCARCHDHKFDPIPQREYYQVASTLAMFRHNLGKPRRVEGLPEESSSRKELRERMAPLRQRLAAIEGELRDELLARAAAELAGEVDEARAKLTRCHEELQVLHAQAPRRFIDVETGAVVVPPAPPSPLRKLLKAQFAGAALLVFAAVALVVVRPWRALVARSIKPGLAAVLGVLLAAGLVAHGTTATDPNVAVQAARTREEVEKDQAYERKETEIRYAQAALAELESRRPGVDYAEILAALPPDQREEYRDLVRRTSALEMQDRLLSGGDVYAVVPEEAPVILHVLERGDVDRPQETVAPAGIEAVSVESADFGLSPDAPDADRRRRIAEWIADPANPLPPRVIVNRVWHYHFGRGIVATPSDFGFSGARPSHPELLDWLAAEFRAGGQRLKDLHRAIVCSASYRQSSAMRPDAAGRDGDNVLLWRKPPLRHDAEVVRDAVLSVAGLLSPQVGGPGYKDFEWQPHPPSGEDAAYWPIDVFGPRYFRRTIYRTWVRGADNALLSTLDCADPTVSTPRRPATTTPLQALALFNDSSLVAAARAFAERLEREAGPGREEQVVRAWRLAFGRDPAPEELEEAAAFLEENSLHQLCLVLLNANEFAYAH